MIDCGFGVRETESRLARLNVKASDITALLVTHEHKDHIGGVFALARRHNVPVWMTRGTYEAVAGGLKAAHVNFCRDGVPFHAGNFSITPFTVPHDAREPVQFTICEGMVKFGVLTDAGHSTPYLIEMLGGCDALVVECNHDRNMLAASSYPHFLKERIGGRYGHLSNESTGAILAKLDRSRLRTVIGAHLSQQNNTPNLAMAALANAVDQSQTNIVIACQEEGFAWINVG